MNTKKYLASAAVAATMFASVFSLASANITGKVNLDINLKSGTHPQPMVVQISPNGKTLVRGTIVAMASNSLTVKSWGGNWIVNVSGDTKIMPVSDMSKFKVGDFVGVQGMVNESNTTWMVDATLVRNWSIKEEAQGNKEAIKQLMKEGVPRNWQGTASNVSGSSLTLTIDGVAYTVNLTANAKVVNKQYVTLGFSSIQNGDTVRVWGPLSGTTITASVVRDVSISAQ